MRSEYVHDPRRCGVCARWRCDGCGWVRSSANPVFVGHDCARCGWTEGTLLEVRHHDPSQVRSEWLTEAPMLGLLAPWWADRYSAGWVPHFPGSQPPEPDAILAAAQRAIGPGSCTCREGHNQHGYWRTIDMTCPECGDSEAKARAVLEAATPLIAAKALREAADAIPSVYLRGSTPAHWLRARADDETRKDA